MGRLQNAALATLLAIVPIGILCRFVFFVHVFRSRDSRLTPPDNVQTVAYIAITALILVLFNAIGQALYKPAPDYTKGNVKPLPKHKTERERAIEEEWGPTAS